MALVCTLCPHADAPTSPHYHLLHRLSNGDTLPLPCVPFASETDAAWWVDALMVGPAWEAPPDDWPVPDRLFVGRTLARLGEWQAGEGRE